jgi:hypothetical protein
VRHDLAAQAKADDALYNAVFPDVRMNQVNKWEVLAEEGNTDDDLRQSALSSKDHSQSSS